MARDCSKKLADTSLNVNGSPAEEGSLFSNESMPDANIASTSSTDSPPGLSGSQLSQVQLQAIMQKIARGEATVTLVKHRTWQTARPGRGRLPPRLMKRHSHRSSLLAKGQPLGEYKGNRVYLRRQHKSEFDPEPDYQLCD